jgi:hypothetical protein
LRLDSLLADRGVEDLAVVVVDPGRNTAVGVNLLGLVDGSVNGLVQLARNGLLRADNWESVTFSRVTHPSRQQSCRKSGRRRGTWQRYPTGLFINFENAERRTVHVNGTLDDVVTKNVTVCEVLGDNGSLNRVSRGLREKIATHLGLVLLEDVALRVGLGSDRSGSGCIGGEDGGCRGEIGSNFKVGTIELWC